MAILAYQLSIPHRNPSEGIAMTKRSEHTPDTPSPQAQAPFSFCIGDTSVRVSFRDDGRPLQDLLRSYFIRLKQDGTPL